MDVLKSKDRRNQSAITEERAHAIVSFVRSHLPDIGPDNEEEVVSSDPNAFREAMKKLNLHFPPNPILGYEDIGDNKISAWITTDDPKLIVRATKAFEETEHTPKFLSIHLMGDNKLHELRSRVKQSLPTNQILNLSQLLLNG